MVARKNFANSPVTLGVLIALASVLGFLNVAFVSLWGAKLACGPIIVVREKEPEVKRRPFWKKKQPAAPPQPEPSAFCQTVWRVLDYVPLLAAEQAEEPVESETCPEEEEEKNPLKKIASLLKRKKKSAATTSSAELQTAFSEVFHPTKSQEKLMHRLAHQFRDHMDDPHHLEERLNNVPWGGSLTSKWWLGHDGGPLLAGYLRIMNWPEDLQSTFPFKLCSKGCPASYALAHTLQWRETFKPWLISPSAIHENRDGFVYFRGHGKSLKNDNHGHGMVWLRAGVHESTPDPTNYFRALLNALDMAVADTLHRSHQKIGKFNVVIDANGASFQILPKLGDAKKGIVMLQDHYPDRLGIVVLANFSRVAEFLLTMIKPLITKEVRDKILILPKDAMKRKEILESIVEKEYIPDYLGGQDTYRFNVKEYYSDKTLHFSDKEAREYLTAMPYHA